ncbi:MAG: DMT family transporter [Acidimicrobiia bacterium]|nr:DMT family transporter [Acidimicrobiia bacterium]
MAFIFALSAGLCYAVASVIQHKVAAAAPSNLSMRPGLLLELVKRPVWLAGIGLDVGAYFLEAAALSVGSIVLVQTLLVSGLLFALPLSAIGRTSRPGRPEWIAAAVVAAGIAVFLAVGEPIGSTGTVTSLEWVLGFGLCVSIAMFMVLITRTAQPHNRALGLAVATGSFYACTAALTKQVVDFLAHDDFTSLFVHWPVYALAVFSIGGLLLNQSAFNAGNLAASLPALAVTNPILSSFLGILLFEEHLKAHGIVQYLVVGIALAAMLIGVIRLARSPFVTGEDGTPGHPPVTPAAP